MTNSLLRFQNVESSSAGYNDDIGLSLCKCYGGLLPNRMQATIVQLKGLLDVSKLEKGELLT